ncbi:MAG TPA: metallopeptidase family protein [Nocardioides sp.]|uniref:metallopeptidase family protein n=1 Tax=Nocardioides sp. TaxID=35761 RepID=UPI002ED85962
MPIDVTPERFDQLVDDAIDTIPEELARLVTNVVVLVEEEPPEGEPDDLLGLYDGIALTHRDTQYGGALPDRIFLFRGPLLDLCDTEEQLVEEVRITVVHEVAHHFGISDARLHELGWA